MLVRPGEPLAWWRAASVADLLDLPAAVIGIDIPIGLPDGPGGRDCDRLAREALGARGSSVFPAPPRVTLGTADYPTACALARQATGTAISLQAFHLLPRIADVDAHLHREHQDRVLEVHPELAFARMTGAPLAPKRTTEGRRARLTALGGPDLSGRPGGVPVTDCLDALAAAWSAARHRDGRSESLPDGPAPRDGRGLAMRIVV